MAEPATEVSGHASQQLRFAGRQLVTSVGLVDPAGASGCSTCDSGGTVHSFFGYLANKPEPDLPPEATQPSMLYLSGPPDALDVCSIGERGWPLAVAADNGTVYLLYSKDSGVRLATVRADGTFGQDLLLSSHQSPEGTLVADQGGWWAAWIESPSLKLFQAYGGWGNGDFPREAITSEVPPASLYGSPSLALGPPNPAGPSARWIYLAWEMVLHSEATAVRLAAMQVQAAGWGEQAWLPAPSTHGFVSSPALAYDGALQAAFIDQPGVDFMRNPSHTTATHRLTATVGNHPMIAASGGRTVVAWTSDPADTGFDLWVSGPAGPAVKLAAHSPYLSVFGLTSYAGKAALLTFEEETNLYVRIQAT
jgi:hypothetical protein